MKRVLASVVVIASALLTLGGAATAVPLRSSAPRSPLSGGWVLVAYKDAQVAVPRTFSIVYPGEHYCSVFTTTGTLFLGTSSVNQSCLEDQSPTSQTTVVYLASQHFSTESLQGYKSILQNGLRLYLVVVDGVPGYYSPLLGAEVAANGPEAPGVLRTFAAAPRRVVLGGGPTESTPPSWHSVSFDGLTFSVPAGWPVKRTDYAMGIGEICAMSGVALGAEDSVLLSSDERFFAVACPLIEQWPQTPVDGLQIDSGPQAPSILSSSRCFSLRGLHACLAAGASYLYSILVLRVSVPGRTRPVIVSIGLAGNGDLARTILYSLHAA